MLHCGPAEVMGPAGAETSGSGGGLQTCAEKIASVWLDEQKARCLKICKHIFKVCPCKEKGAQLLLANVSNIIVYCLLGKRQREKKAYGCILPEMDVA